LYRGGPFPGGILAKKNYGIPLVNHGPLAGAGFGPWKREQLAGGYDFSLWVEKTALEMADAIIAVSREPRSDITIVRRGPARVHVIHNGIDLQQYRKWIQPARSSTTASIQTHRICCSSPDHRRKDSDTCCAHPIHESRFPNRPLCCAGHAEMQKK